MSDIIKHMFLDKVIITVKAGCGGNGHTSFHRDKLTMRGGPDGGDGGKGGDVFFVGTTGNDNLIEFRFTKKFEAQSGENGSKRNRTGANGADLKIPVPLGTKVLNEHGKIICDITKNGEEFRVLKGGAGGRGNARFATSKKQTPNFSQSGVKTAPYNVMLELNCIADVGLVGFPNVGKSTLLSVISRANPKIANYHFTTLYPNIAVTTAFEKNFIVADIPGLIEGASKGAGLGIDFLKHISRTRLLIHIVDISEHEGRDAVQDFNTINRELESFSSELAMKPQLVALNKTDIISGDSDASCKIDKFVKAINKGKRKFKIFQISAATRQGIDELIRAAASELEKLPKTEAQIPQAILEKEIDKNSFEIDIIDGEFYVKGPFIDNLIRGVVLSDTESNSYFQRRLESSGIISALKNRGMQNGDTVHVSDIEFEYID